MKRLLIVVFLAINISLSGTTYYVATNGNDSNPGTISQPFATWQKGFQTANTGDLVYIRGGIYYTSGILAGNEYHGVYLSGGNSGTADNMIRIWAYPGETPVLDCINMTQSSYVRNGLFLSDVSYWWIKGLTIRNVKDSSVAHSRGFMGTAVSYCLFEQMTVNDCADGFAMSGFSDYNKFLNCDSYNNSDIKDGGDFSNGWSTAGYASGGGTHLEIVGCRSWHNSDDGFDFLNADNYSGGGYITVDNCWSFRNGYNRGNGVGFKLGNGYLPIDGGVQRLIHNCLAWDNTTLGFDEGQDPSRINSVAYNNTSYNNDVGFFWDYTSIGSYAILQNNLSYANRTSDAWVRSSVTQNHNTWNGGVSVTSGDFLSLDDSGADGPRQNDGSLPDIAFLHLSSGSDLIDAGTDVGLKYGGNAPDLGAYETGTDIVVSPPVFKSSVIQNSTPSILELTYNLSLANIVPASSSFTVTVNSTARTVNSVAVSGTRVVLTLASPVTFGGIVTVAYTKPSSNPLQTSSGGLADSFSAQRVTNNVAAVIPVYVSSAIENSAPAKVVITYNMSLAGTTPAASAFGVNVNSVSRSVSSVSVSGTSVILTLVSGVTTGNTVTLSYTKPSSNPLQNSSGGQAASFTAQPVTNRVLVNNTPPVVMVNYQSQSYSGFVSEINASGSYDVNNDKLTFTWVIPANIPVSATTGPKIQYLGPMVDASQKVKFTLNVSDGKTTQSKIIPVEILPYEPGLDVAEVVDVEASGYLTPNYPYNIIDGNIGTIWAVDGDNQWLILELKELFSVQHVKLAFQPGQKKESYFDVLGSEDKITWEQILTKSNSCAFSGDLQVFDFPPSKTDKEFRYIKLIGHSNSVDTWNYISEFRIFGYKHKIPTGYEEQPVKLYPNPAHNFFNVKIEESSVAHDFIKIISLTGKVLFQEKIDPAVNEFQVPVNLFKGIYLVQVGSGSITLFSQKLVISN